MIIVSGMPCGGTSLTAGVLHHLGVDMGDIADPEELEDHDRPYMHYECLRLQALIKGLGDFPPIERMAGVFRKYVERRERKPGLHGVKNFTIQFLGFRPDLLEGLDLKTVHAKRDIGQVLCSDIKWKGWDLERAGKMGKAHMAMTRLLTEINPSAVLSFEEAMEDPAGATKKLAARLGIPWRPEAAEFIDPIRKGLLNVSSGKHEATAAADPGSRVQGRSRAA